jgi:hypothetical protein
MELNYLSYSVSIHCKALNVITLGQVQTDNINQMIIITDSGHAYITVLSSVRALSLWSHKLIDNRISEHIIV